jgi:hypothetical protein
VRAPEQIDDRLIWRRILNLSPYCDTRQYGPCRGRWPSSGGAPIGPCSVPMPLRAAPNLKLPALPGDTYLIQAKARSAHAIQAPVLIPLLGQALAPPMTRRMPLTLFQESRERGCPSSSCADARDLPWTRRVDPGPIPLPRWDRGASAAVKRTAFDKGFAALDSGSERRRRLLQTNHEGGFASLADWLDLPEVWTRQIV